MLNTNRIPEDTVSGIVRRLSKQLTLQDEFHPEAIIDLGFRKKVKATLNIVEDDNCKKLSLGVIWIENGTNVLVNSINPIENDVPNIIPTSYGLLVKDGYRYKFLAGDFTGKPEEYLTVLVDLTPELLRSFTRTLQVIRALELYLHALVGVRDAYNQFSISNLETKKWYSGS